MHEVAKNVENGFAQQRENDDYKKCNYQRFGGYAGLLSLAFATRQSCEGRGIGNRIHNGKETEKDSYQLRVEITHQHFNSFGTAHARSNPDTAF